MSIDTVAGVRVQYLQNSPAVQGSLKGFLREVRAVQTTSLGMLCKLVTVITRAPVSDQPLLGRTLFTNASGKTGKYAVVWHDGKQWCKRVEICTGTSTQQLELKTVLLALQLSKEEPVNVVTDSQYCFQMAMLYRDCTGGTTLTAVAFYNALSLCMTPVSSCMSTVTLSCLGLSQLSTSWLTQHVTWLI